METELNTTGQSAIVRSLNVEELSEWESLVRQSAQGTLFHSRLWLDALGEPYKLFGWFTGGQLRGGFAAGIVGPKAASAPYSALTPYLGLLFAEGDTKYVTRISTEKQISRAFAVFLKQHFNSVQFRFPPEIIDLQPFIWEGFQIQLRYTYRLELRDIDAMLANMDKRCRRDLVAAEKQGIKIESDVPFTEVLPLCEMSLKRSGVETSALMVAERVEAVLRHAGRCRGFLARSREKTPLGAVWIVWDEKRAYYLLGGYSDPMKSGNAVALALWHAIQFTALDLRLSEFDFEGSMVPAIERFFRKFGGTIKPTYTVHYEKRISPLQRLWGKALSHFKKD
jgi:hypothetical protein